jgi:L-ascorbate metabolism protein UlaG (beta-lactamase superfamily)
VRKLIQQFGGKITKELQNQYKESENWSDGKFKNLEVTTMDMGVKDIPKMLYKQFTDKAKRQPETPIPVVPFDKEAFLKKDGTFKFIWYGHSVILMRMNGKTILIDPMLGPNASPIAPFKTNRFSKNTLDLITDFPEIDLLLISHDHYDHLDYDSILRLKEKTKQFYVALGVKRHLVKWGIEADKVKEFDWWNNANFADIEITYTPTRHFSGRGITDREKSLWGGWVFKTETESIWFSGDGGYGKHFKEIGEKLGPFDFGFMECGQYNEKWHAIHMFPEESVQAAKDAGVKKVMPVHWAGFALAQHAWTEPVDEFAKSAVLNNLEAIYPQIGQLVDPKITQATTEWWKK